MRQSFQKKCFLIVITLFIILQISPEAYSITLRGNLYNSSFDTLNDVVIVVNSDPIQRYVAKNGTYSFELPPGQYKLSARTFGSGDKETLGIDTSIIIKQEGTFVSDLVLKPINDTEQPKEPSEDSKSLTFEIFITLIIFIAILVLVYFFFRYKSKKNSQENLLDDDSRHMLSIIKSKKRITQKELRSHFDLSEAKVSLIISELEKKGMVERIKKGRGNIVVFKKEKPDK